MKHMLISIVHIHYHWLHRTGESPDVFSSLGFLL